MTRIAAVFAAAAVGVLVLAATATPATTTRLTGTVGPGFTITLKKGARKVTRLPAGRYIITVQDRSGIHSFHLRGPRVNKVITSVPFTGRKSFTVRLRRGRYTYVCDPHSSDMRGSFRVV